MLIVCWKKYQLVFQSSCTILRFCQSWSSSWSVSPRALDLVTTLSSHSDDVSQYLLVLSTGISLMADDVTGLFHVVTTIKKPLWWSVPSSILPVFKNWVIFFLPLSSESSFYIPLRVLFIFLCCVCDLQWFPLSFVAWYFHSPNSVLTVDFELCWSTIYRFFPLYIGFWYHI